MTIGIINLRKNKKLKGILTAIHSDDCISPIDIALMYAMIMFYKQGGEKDFFQVSRSGLMKISKISSTRTYHKSIKKLMGLGYISYTPSYHPKFGSLVGWG